MCEATLCNKFNLYPVCLRRFWYLYLLQRLCQFSAHARQGSGQSLLSSSLLPESMQVEIYGTIILSIFCIGAWKKVSSGCRTATSAPHKQPTQRLSRPPRIQKLGYVKDLFINSMEKYCNHTTHPFPLSNLTTTLNTHNLRRDVITNTHNPQHLKPPPQTSATHNQVSTKPPVPTQTDLYNTP